MNSEQIAEVVHKTLLEIFQSEYRIDSKQMSTIIADKLTPLLAEKKVMPRAEFEKITKILAKFECPIAPDDDCPKIKEGCQAHYKQHLQQYITVSEED